MLGEEEDKLFGEEVEEMLGEEEEDKLFGEEVEEMLGEEEAGIFCNVFFCVRAWSGGFFCVLVVFLSCRRLFNENNNVSLSTLTPPSTFFTSAFLPSLSLLNRKAASYFINLSCFFFVRIIELPSASGSGPSPWNLLWVARQSFLARPGLPPDLLLPRLYSSQRPTPRPLLDKLKKHFSLTLPRLKSLLLSLQISRISIFAPGSSS